MLLTLLIWTAAKADPRLTCQDLFQGPVDVRARLTTAGELNPREAERTAIVTGSTEAASPGLLWRWKRGLIGSNTKSDVAVVVAPTGAARPFVADTGEPLEPRAGLAVTVPTFDDRLLSVGEGWVWQNGGPGEIETGDVPKHEFFATYGAAIERLLKFDEAGGAYPRGRIVEQFRAGVIVNGMMGDRAVHVLIDGTPAGSSEIRVFDPAAKGQIGNWQFSDRTLITLGDGRRLVRVSHAWLRLPPVGWAARVRARALQPEMREFAKDHPDVLDQIPWQPEYPPVATSELHVQDIQDEDSGRIYQLILTAVKTEGSTGQLPLALFDPATGRWADVAALKERTFTIRGFERLGLNLRGPSGWTELVPKGELERLKSYFPPPPSAPPK